MRSAKLILGFTLVSWSLSACGSSAVSSQQLADTQAAIRSADELGAQQRPRAALHLALARDQLELAQRLIRDGRSEQANAVLERAESDAELAVTLAREAETRERARRALERVRELEQQAQVEIE